MTKDNGQDKPGTTAGAVTGRRRRLLLVGSQALRDTLAHALPGCEVQIAGHPLDGVWLGGRHDFDAAFVSLRLGPRALRAVRSLREVAPRLRIVVSCPPSDEPLAQQAVSEGADDYVLEPLRSDDVRNALGLAPAWRPPAAVSGAGPSPQEITRLSEVLRNLGDGPLATLDRLTTLVMETFNAVGVTIEIDDHACSSGEVGQPVLAETIERRGRPVGRIALGRCRSGTYAANTAARLAEYARLVEATIVQARERRRWERLAWTDDLSGLHNRRYFNQALDELLRRAGQQRMRLTILLFDIDDFKGYNDRHGHDAGDKLIREVAQLLRRCTRETDIVARYGGDEFAVIFWDAEEPRVPGSQHPQEPMVLSERFCKAISEHHFEFLGADAPGPVTISGGLACFPWNGNTRPLLLAAADEALLEAKRSGKNRILLAGRPETSDTPTQDAEP